jgi:hypothetical protein
MDRVDEPSRRWYAWHDWMPGSKPTLLVKGELSFASPGYRARLEKHDLQDEGEGTLVLDLYIEASEGSGDKTLSTKEVQEVRYEEQTNTPYQDIMIISRTRVPVKRTS